MLSLPERTLIIFGSYGGQARGCFLTTNLGIRLPTAPRRPFSRRVRIHAGKALADAKQRKTSESSDASTRLA